MEIDFCLSCKKCTVCETNAYVRETLNLISDKFFLRKTSYCTSYCQRSIIFRGGSRDFGKGGSFYVGHHGCWMKKILGFRWSKKGQNNVGNYTFLAKYFYQYFQIFSIFIYNENLPMKSYKFFKACKRIDKKREKTLIEQSMRKEKLRKIGLCFITGCFIKPFKGTLMQI